MIVITLNLEQAEGFVLGEHCQPSSTWQRLEHPSPSRVLESSHPIWEERTRSPSPQMSEQMLEVRFRKSPVMLEQTLHSPWRGLLEDFWKYWEGRQEVHFWAPEPLQVLQVESQATHDWVGSFQNWFVEQT